MLFPEESARVNREGALTHLDRLEAESIHIIREVVAEHWKRQRGYAAFGPKSLFPTAPSFSIAPCGYHLEV
jgi:3'-phosphoadenosine 5'-phosphosulfate sulfotransferase (PAPS reductase)/FAD synthetase